MWIHQLDVIILHESPLHVQVYSAVFISVLEHQTFTGNYASYDNEEVIGNFYSKLNFNIIYLYILLSILLFYYNNY